MTDTCLTNNAVPYCDRRFNTIENKINEHSQELDEHSKKLEQQAIDIAVNQSQTKTVNDSLKSLIKALWGLAGTIFASLLGFVLWYIQSLAK